MKSVFNCSILRIVFKKALKHTFKMGKYITQTCNQVHLMSYKMKLIYMRTKGLNILVKQIDEIIEFYKYKLLLKLFSQKNILI